MQNTNTGWAWFQAEETNPEADDKGLALAFARCFRGPDGERVLVHLRAMTLDQAMGPTASDATLRHVEGQRQLVSYIQSQIVKGRGHPQTNNS